MSSVPRKWARALAALLASALLGVLVPPAAALPVLRVRAETRLELRAEVRGGRSAADLVLQGHLRDDRGAGLRRSPIVLALVDPASDETLLEREVSTENDGSFALTLALRDLPSIQSRLATGEVRATARFLESAHHGPIFVERDVDPARVPLRLHVEVTGGGEVDLDAEALTVRVRASSSEGGAALPIELRSETELLQSAGTGPDGVVEFQLEPAILGPPGSGRIIARSPGDALRAGAQTEVPIVRVRAPSLSLGAPDEERWLLAGELRDRGGPLGGEAVGVYLEGEHFATVLTDADGRFTLDLDSRRAESDAPLMVEAHFDGSGPGHPPTRSPPLLLSPPASAPLGATWIVLALLLGASGVALAARKRPDESLERARPARPGAELSPPHVGAKSNSVRIETFSLHDESTIEVEVRVKAASGGPSTSHASERGVVSLELPDGRHRLEVRAPGFVPVELDLSCPHSGAYTRVRVRLERWRERALRVLRERALPWLGEDGWQSTTVHALADRHDAPRPLRELAARIEPLVYAEDGADAEALRALEQERATLPDAERSLTRSSTEV